MPVFNNILAGAAGQAGGGAAGGDRSLRFNSGDSSKLTRTFSAGNRKTFTYSCWVKRSQTGTKHSLLHAGSTYYRFDSNDDLYFYHPQGNVNTDALFRDPSAWYHIVLAVDTTQSTAANRVKIYVNGTLASLSGTYPNQDVNVDINSAAVHTIGSQSDFDVYLNGYLTEIHFVDGVSGLTASDFGEYDDNNVWQPKAYSGTYGTNGFHLDFSDNSSAAALGTDRSGNSNTWTVNNLSVASGVGNDSMIDTPTNYEASSGNNGGNYATFNPIDKGSNITLSNGNLDVSKSGTTWANAAVRGTIGVSSGKWYWEITKTNAAAYSMFGVAVSAASFSESYGAPNNETWTYISNSGNKLGDTDGGAGAAYGASFTNGDVIGVALDMDAGTLVFYKNGVSQGTAYSTLSGKTVFPWIHLYNGADTASVNFGQRPFEISSVPTGHKSYCTTNLPTPTIANGSDYFYALASTGTVGGGTVTNSNANFTPDLVWVKRRNAGERHKLYDVVRGTDGTRYKHLESDGSDAEGSGESGITAFVAGGYTSEGGGHINSAGQPFISWMWDAGTSNTSISAGGLNSSFYNQDQVWSNFLSRNTVSGGSDLGSTTDAFNGTIWSMSNSANCGYSNDYTGSSITFAPTSGTLVGQVVKLYQRIRPSTVTVNGTAATITTSGDTRICTVDLGSPQNITSVVTTATTIGQTNAFSYIEVDGKLLIDSGVSLSGVTQYPSIASTVRANPSAGFSIVSWTGTGANGSIGFGLNSKPQLVITKNRDDSSPWVVDAIGVLSSGTNYLLLNSTQAAGSGGTTATTSVLNILEYNDRNGSGDGMIALCISPVDGYSAVGSYTGNGSATLGTFVYLGFKPRWIMVKRTDDTGHWAIFDSARSLDNDLKANTAEAEGSAPMAFFSNGFAPRNSYSMTNESGGTYLYLAFAEHPFKTARAR